MPCFLFGTPGVSLTPGAAIDISQAGITRDEPGREQQEINLYAVLRKEPNWRGGNRTHRLKRFVGYTLPRESRRHAQQICPHGEANACLFFSSGLISLESVKNAGVPLLAPVTTVEYLKAPRPFPINHSSRRGDRTARFDGEVSDSGDGTATVATTPILTV